MGDKFEVELANGNKKEATLITRVKPEGKDIEYIYYFIEDEEIVLVDYKTDRVRKGEEQHLIDLYHTQLEDYAQALERMLQKKVKETYIYSFALGKMIPV